VLVSAPGGDPARRACALELGDEEASRSGADGGDVAEFVERIAPRNESVTLICLYIPSYRQNRYRIGRIELLPRAEKELAALPFAVQDQIIAKLEMLRDFPELGVAMFDAFDGYRALLAARRSYRIIYRIVSADLLEVAYIRHPRSGRLCGRRARSAARVGRGRFATGGSDI